ncbi:MAG: ABC transporter permease [Nitrososphaerales archaeon]
MIRDLRVLKAVMIKDLKHYYRYPSGTLFLFIVPFLFTFLLSTMGSFVGGTLAKEYFYLRTGVENFFLYQILGTNIWIMAWVILEDIGTSIRNEQIKGTLEQNFLVPINKFFFLLGLSFAHTLLALLSFIVVVGSSLALVDLESLPRLFPSSLILLLGLIPLFGLGFVFSSLVIHLKEPYSFTHLINTFFSVVAGTYYPVHILPYWVQWISYSIPHTYLIDEMRKIIFSNQLVVELYGNTIILLSMGIIYMILGLRLFRFFERRARINGGLSKF